MVAALCYLLPVVTGVLFLFVEPFNRNRMSAFTRFSRFFLARSPGGGCRGGYCVRGNSGRINSYALLHLVWTLFRLGVLALWLLLMYRAYNRERWVLPVVGEMAQKFV